MPQLGQSAGVMALASLPPSLGQGTSSSPLEFVLQTTGSYSDLGKAIGQLMEKMSK
jgi:multidrug efflux pump